MKLYNADCLDIMREMNGNTIDSIVTDPPYGLEFMGKEWDHGIPGIHFWQEALRVCKPGAHMLAFGGTRTHHRLMVAIEGAGWEIRDCLMWVYGSGFPKSLDVSKAIDKAAGAEREVVGRKEGERYKYDFKNSSGKFVNTRDADDNDRRSDVGILTAPATDAAKQWNGWGTALKPAYEILILAQKPYKTERYLNVASLYIIEAKLWSLLPASVAEKNFGLNPVEFGEAFGSVQWNADERSSIQEDLLEQMDTSQFVSVMTSCLNTVISWRDTLEGLSNNLKTSTTSTETDPTIDLKTLNSCLSVLTPHIIIRDAIQTHGQWQHASPVVKYLNAVSQKLNATHILSVLDDVSLRNAINFREETALKLSPNWEPIILCRKPLDGTVAENVLKWGVGAINIDGCRVETPENDIGKKNWHTNRESFQDYNRESKGIYGSYNPHATSENNRGRFPANLIHDGSDEVLAVFPESKGQSGDVRGTEPSRTGDDNANCYGEFGRVGFAKRNDSGSAARFFYTAKADSGERNKYLNGKNKHPTVKPVDLLRYLCRLITPPKGIILDPFAGSGSTGVAAFEEGFDYILVEKDPESFETAKIRNAQVRLPI